MPKASASAVAQSMPSPVSIALRRLSRKRWIVRWTSKSSGTAVIFSPISFSVSIGDAGLAAARIVVVVGGLQARPAAVEPVGLVRLVALAGLELGFEPRAPVGLHLLDFAFGDDALADQLLAVDLERRRMRADLLVHQRLGEGRLVAFVVAEAAIAEHVDDDRLVELLPELGRDLGRVDHRFRIVAVDVEDRRLDHLGDVGRIGRGARIARIGGEADLVVDDEMDRAAGAVALAGPTGRSIRRPRPGRRRPHRRGSAAAAPWRGLPASRRAGPAWRAPCRAPPDRRFPDATGWRSATDAPCCRRTRGPTRRRDDTSRRPSLRPRRAWPSRP